MGSVVDLNEARERLERSPPQHPILEALDVLAVALADHGHTWTDREVDLYENAVRLMGGTT